MVQKTKKDKKKVQLGIIHIHATFNNTIITVSDLKGDTLSWASAGTCGFNGARKNSPFAAQVALEKALGFVSGLGLKKVDILMNGQGSGRETAIRSIKTAGLIVRSIRDVTPVAHNGCRPPSCRRI